MAEQVTDESKAQYAEPLRVLITGAGGKIGYCITPLIASGAAFGANQPVIIHLLDIPTKLNSMKAMCMELEDCAHPLLKQVVIATINEPEIAFKDIDFAVLVGGFSKWKKERNEMLEKNIPIFVSQGECLQKYAKDSCKILVVANPVNTNALLCALHAPKIPKTNFCAMNRLDQNRTIAQLAKKANCSVSDIKNVTVWGNHSDTQAPDVSNATIFGKPAAETLDDSWVKNELYDLVKTRAKTVMDVGGFSSVFSASYATIDCLREWFCGTPHGDCAAMGVWSDKNPFGIEEGLFYGMPCVCKNGEYQIVLDWKLNDETRERMKQTEKELLEEKEFALSKK
eukprot:124318_1